MSRKLLIALTAVLATFGTATTPSEAGGELVVIVNAKNGQSPSLEETKRMFVGQTMYWPGNLPAHPITRPPESRAGEGFFKAIQVSPSRFRRIWQEKQLSGQGQTPETLPTGQAVVAKVAADPGAIGFAMSDEVPANGSVKVLPLR